MSGYEIARTPHWVLRHHPDPSPLVGWLFLDTVRHVGGPADFTPDEAAAWGPAVQEARGRVCPRCQPGGPGPIPGPRLWEPRMTSHFAPDPDSFPGSDPFPGSVSVPGQLQAIRSELAQLHQSVLELRSLVQILVASAPSIDLPLASSASSPSTSLSRRNPERLAAEVQRRRTLLTAEDLDPLHGDTELDVLIDRLHDLALQGL